MGLTYFMGINIISFILCGQDKLAAKGRFGRRISEALLHQMELFGGSAGSFVAQRLFKHKISKTSYQRTFSLVLLLQLAAGVAWAYFIEPTWTAVGCSGASAMMLTNTVLRLRYIDNWWSLPCGKGGVQPWQIPMTNKSMQRRQPHHQARYRPYRGKSS